MNIQLVVLLCKQTLEIPSPPFFPEIPASTSVDTGELGKSDSGWTSLNLRCAVDWPLHILLTPTVLER